MYDFETALEEMATLIPKEGPWGLVLYSDGGYRMDVGHAGWGLHGYIYDHVEKKTGYGLKRCEPTTVGYVGPGIRQIDEKGKALRIRLKNGMEAEKVRITHYIDAYGNDDEGVRPTNNSAELSGLYHALQIIARHKPPIVQLVLDSEYVLKGCLNWRVKWKASNWTKADGTEVASKDLWLKVDSLLDELAKMEIKIAWDWAKGHMDDIGNNMADEWAGKVMNGRENGAELRGMRFSPTAKYWTPTADIHPLLKEPRLYLNVQVIPPQPLLPGTTYHFGSNTGAEVIVGETSTQKGYCVVTLPHPDKVIESVREYYQAVCSKNPYVIVLEVKNDLLCTPKTHSDIFQYGYLHLRSTKHAGVKNVHHKDIASPIDPPMLLNQALGNLSKLESLLSEVIADTVDLTYYAVTDITSLLYTVTPGKKGDVWKVNRDSTSHIKAEVDFIADQAVSQKLINLSYGIDLPRQSILSAVGHLQPRIVVYTWRDSEVTIRYLTVLITSIGVGIWCGVHSNIAFIHSLTTPIQR